MNMCKYCKEHNFTKEEYLQFKENITAVATAIRSQLAYKGGVYYNTSDIIHYAADPIMKHFIIQELKNLNIEFINNDEFYRVVE